jgi:hypothetical protein
MPATGRKRNAAIDDIDQHALPGWRDTAPDHTVIDHRLTFAKIRDGLPCRESSASSIS